MAVFGQHVFDGLRAVDEQAAIETALFLGDPLAAAVLANEDDGRCRATRGRFDELHVRCPSGGEQRVLPAPRTHPSLRFPARMFGWFWLVGRRLDSCSQYLLVRI